MTKAGNTPIIKIYPGTGHFIHTHFPGECSKDVVDFIFKGKAEGKEEPDTLGKPIKKEKEEKKPGFSK